MLAAAISGPLSHLGLPHQKYSKSRALSAPRRNVREPVDQQMQRTPGQLGTGSANDGMDLTRRERRHRVDAAISSGGGDAANHAATFARLLPAACARLARRMAAVQGPIFEHAGGVVGMMPLLPVQREAPLFVIPGLTAVGTS